MSVNVSKGFLGSLTLKKTVDNSGVAAVGAESFIPYLEVQPLDPLNNTYPPLANANLYPAINIKGKRTPSITVRTIAHESYLTPNLLNSLLITSDARGETDVFGARLREDNTILPDLVVDGLRCTMVSLSSGAGGGPVSLDLGFLATTFSGVTTFTTPTVIVGNALDASGTRFGSAATAALVRSWRLNIVRPVSYDMFFNRSYNSSDTSCGQLSGTLEVEFSPVSGTVPTTTITIDLFTPAGTQIVKFVGYLNMDVPMRTRSIGFGSQIHTYTLIRLDTGGAPIVLTAS